MAGVVGDMEEKGEMKREKVEKKEESLEKVRVEHSLEGDFQFLPNELTLHNPDQVNSFFAQLLIEVEMFISIFHFSKSRLRVGPVTSARWRMRTRILCALPALNREKSQGFINCQQHFHGV